MGLYESSAATVNRLLLKFGAPVILTRSVQGDYDPALGEPPAPTVTTYTGTGAKFDYAETMIDGTRIRQGDQRVYLSTIGVVQPIPDDTLTIAGAVFTVINSRPLQPALVSVLFDCQVRGVRP